MNLGLLKTAFRCAGDGERPAAGFVGSPWLSGPRSLVVPAAEPPQIQGIGNYSRGWKSRQKTRRGRESEQEGGGSQVPVKAWF